MTSSTDIPLPDIELTVQKDEKHITFFLKCDAGFSTSKTFKLKDKQKGYDWVEREVSRIDAALRREIVRQGFFTPGGAVK